MFVSNTLSDFLGCFLIVNFFDFLFILKYSRIVQCGGGSSAQLCLRQSAGPILLSGGSRLQLHAPSSPCLRHVFAHAFELFDFQSVGTMIKVSNMRHGEPGMIRRALRSPWRARHSQSPYIDVTIGLELI